MTIVHQVTSIDDVGQVSVRVSDDDTGKITNRYVIVPGAFADVSTWVDTDFSKLPDVPDFIRQVAQSTWLNTGAVAKYKTAHPFVPPTPPSADQVRDAAFVADTTRAELVDKLRTATPAQIETYINNKVTNLTTAKDFLIQLTKVLATIVRS